MQAYVHLVVCFTYQKISLSLRGYRDHITNGGLNNDIHRVSKKH